VTVSKESAGNTSSKLKIGAVVGPTDLFAAEQDDPEASSVTYKCKVSSGSVLQLKYMDMLRAKYGDRSLAVDPDEGLSQEEISVRDVSTFGESRLSRGMFLFLKKNNLLATR
jgi:hypothetical protein